MVELELLALAASRRHPSRGAGALCSVWLLSRHRSVPCQHRLCPLLISDKRRTFFRGRASSWFPLLFRSNFLFYVCGQQSRSLSECSQLPCSRSCLQEGAGHVRAVPCWLSPCRATRGQLVPLFHSSLRDETYEMGSLLKNDVFKEV